MGRVLHLCCGLWLMVVLYGSTSLVEKMEMAMSGAVSLRKYLDAEFVKDNVYVAEMVGILVLCDVTMLQFMPWRKSRFFVRSEGYPNMQLMLVCMTTKTVQSLVSVICEIMYVVESSNVDGPRSSATTQGLFYTNIIIGVVTICMEVMMLSMRGEVLRLEERKSVFSAGEGPAEEGLAVDDAKPSDEEEGERETSGTRASAISDVMPEHSNDFLTENPMHAAGIKSATLEKAALESADIELMEHKSDKEEATKTTSSSNIESL